MNAMDTHRRKLTPDQVLKIYSAKISRSEVGQGKALAKSFGISEKTVRDIWNGKTWNEVTAILDSKRLPILRKPVGRPKGSHDKKPRQGFRI